MPHHITSRILLSAFCIFLLISCSSPAPTSAPLLPTETAVPPSTEIPPTEVSLSTETLTPFPTPTPDLERPQYVLDLQLNYSTKAALVNETITYPNWTGETLTSLVLAVEPNLWSGGFSPKSLGGDKQAISRYSPL